MIMTYGSEERINKILLELSNEISFEYDLSSDTMHLSEKYKVVYGRKNRITHFLRDSKGRYALSASTVLRLEDLKHLMDYGDSNHYVQFQWPNKHGKYEWCELVFRHVVDKLGNVKAVGVWRNIDRSKREQVILQHQVVSDGMEGMANRIGIEEEVERELARLNSTDKAALFEVDFDDMKQIQFSFGVLAVEQLLHMFAKELLIHFHEDGIVGHLGSDKFLVYVCSIKDVDTAKVLAKRIRKLLEGLCNRLNISRQVTVTIGVRLVEGNMTYKDILEDADTALRHGKNNGKNQYVVFSPNMQSEKYLHKIRSGKTEKGKKIYDTGKIWPDFVRHLYQSGDEMRGIRESIAFLGNVFKLDKIMVWEYETEYDVGRQTISNTYQWANEGIRNTQQEQQNIEFSYEEMPLDYNSDGIFYCSSREGMPDKMREYANKEKIEAILESRIMSDEGVCLGLIDFIVCHGNRVWVQEEIDFLLLITQVIGDVLRKRQLASKMEEYYGNTRDILNNVVTGIYVIDQETKEVYYYNEAVENIFPCFTRNLQERKIHPCDNCTSCDLAQIMSEENINTMLGRGKNGSGFILYDEKKGLELELKATKMLWENKKKAYIITINEHMASPEEQKRRKHQEYLEKRYAFIYSHSCDCIFDIDLEKDYYDVTIVREGAAWDSLKEHGVYSELFQKELFGNLAYEDRDRIITKFSLENLRQAMMRGETMLVDNFVVYGRNGNLHSKEVRAFLMEEDGKQSVVATYCDVTAQRRKEMQDLLERQKLTRAVVNVYPLVLSLNVTKDEFYLMANMNNNPLLTVDSGRVSTTVLDLAMHIHPEDRDRFMDTFDRKHLMQYFSSGKNENTVQMRLRYPNGNYHWISVMSIRIDNPLNEDMLIYMFVRNIDKQKQMDQNLRDALTAAERANKAKSEFLSRMSHEIRTPMNAIIGMTEIALTEVEKEAVHGNSPIGTYLGKIKVSAKYLLSLINNVLDVSRIESNKVVIEKKEFFMQDLLENIQNMIAPQAKERQLQFVIEQNNDFSEVYLGDVLRINQILINLLSNALKFTEKGGSVSLRVKENRREGKDSYICFTVEDTGIGMSEEFMKNMYKPFEQENANSPEGMMGTGLGLSITRNLISLMDGHIKCKSRLGGGTTFIVELKVDVVDKQSPMFITTEEQQKKVDKQSAVPLLAGKKILLAEDNELNQEIAVTMLEMLDINVECVENGELAVQKFLEMGEDYYDMVLMDIRMPVKNGLDATADIRAIHGMYAKEIPILAMSANAFAEDKAKAFANGMTDYIVKPIDFDVLQEMLVKYLLE